MKMFIFLFYNNKYCYKELNVYRGKEREIVSEKERKEENVLFNDALNTFYLRLYGI